MARKQIDRDKLRAAIRSLGKESVVSMLDDAITLLPQAEVLKLVERYLDPAGVCLDDERTDKLLVEVKEFEKASLAGQYYEGFFVNSKNYMQKSNGTRGWITKCERLLDRCVAESAKGNPAEVCQAFNIIFGLLDHIDKCLDDVIFFADEGGSWQVGVNWEKVLPAWFKVLSVAAAPAEYAQRITTLLLHHYNYKRVAMLALARKAATPEQRKALPKP